MDNSGLWIGTIGAIVLAKVSHAIWVDEEDDVTSKEKASYLAVFVDGANMSMNDLDEMICIRIDEADAFLLALATYWETRTR